LHAQNSFKVENVNQFRCGDFKKANEDVQKCWILFVGKIMPCINKNWNDDAVKISSFLSKHTTASDEALAMISIQKKMESWKLGSDSVGDDNTLASPASFKKKKSSRDKWTDEDIEKFYEQQVNISSLRKDPITGEGWDMGYQQYLASMVTASGKSTKNNNDLLKKAFMNIDFETSTLSSAKDVTVHSNQSGLNNTDNDQGGIDYNIPINLDDDDAD
jgi:hypothetical protein